MNTIIYFTLFFTLACTICLVILLVRFNSMRSSSNDISAKDIDRLENRLATETQNLRQELTNNVTQLRQELTNIIAQFRKENNDNAKNQRDDLSKSLSAFQEAFDENVEKLNAAQKVGFDDMEKRQNKLVDATEKKLEEMRATVDEKLQKTLNERLGQSFKLVGEQLESVQKGLGEMKNLASDVGGLKNALTNVKIRGNFGELQLKALLEQMLSPEQYDENVATIPGSTERVEFAIKLPGKDETHSTVYLPIDSKFPKDVFDQYVDANDTGDANLIKAKSQLFETTIIRMANDIKTKYVAVPHTTDFAILFVPVENIYAEIIRRTKLTQDLRDTYHILVTGPTTLGALLSSLQMGFRTLAIEKRSSEVWKTLSAVKTEFCKFAGLLEKAKKNIDSASNTLDELQGKRTRAISRKLRDVEELPADQAASMLADYDNPDLEDEE